MAGLESKAWNRLATAAYGVAELPHMERLEVTQRKGWPDILWTGPDGLSGLIELKAIRRAADGFPLPMKVRPEQAVVQRRMAEHNALVGTVCHVLVTGGGSHWLFFPAERTVTWARAIVNAPAECRVQRFPDTLLGMHDLMLSWRRDRVAIVVRD